MWRSERAEFLDHGLGLEPAAREAGRVGDLHHLLAAVLGEHLERAWIAIRGASIPRAIVDDLEPRHQGADLRIVPALAVELGKPELPVDERDGGVMRPGSSFCRRSPDVSGMTSLKRLNRSTAPRRRRCISIPAATTLCPVAKQGKALTLAAMM